MILSSPSRVSIAISITIIINILDSGRDFSGMNIPPTFILNVRRLVFRNVSILNYYFLLML
jgi:hypothetical protein